MWCIHTVEYYSAFNKKEILSHATTWMNLDDIMLSGISQSQKDKHWRFHLYEAPRIVKFIKTASRVVVARGEGRFHVIFLKHTHYMYTKFTIVYFLFLIWWELFRKYKIDPVTKVKSQI